MNQRNNILIVNEDQIKKVTQILIDKKVLFHPNISPAGIPDFKNYRGREFVVMLDRNILVDLLRLVETGTLKDRNKLKIVASLLFWSDFNNVALTSGFALMEHSHFKGDNSESSHQHNVFQSIHDNYSPNIWLALAQGQKTTIPKIEIRSTKKTEYLIDNEHHTWNYLQILKLCQLLVRSDLSRTEKIEKFHQWSYDNVLIGIYSTCYAMLFLSSQAKLSVKLAKIPIDEILHSCSNTAWDLTYLSFWSTLYWTDRGSSEVFLFATMDKELKKIFTLVHSQSENAFVKILGEQEATRAKKDLERIYKPRPKRDFDPVILAELRNKEEENLLSLMTSTLSNTRS